MGDYSVLDSDVKTRIPFFKGWIGVIRFYFMCLALLVLAFYVAFCVNERGPLQQVLWISLRDTAQQWPYLLSTSAFLTGYAAYKQSWL